MAQRDLDSMRPMLGRLLGWHFLPAPLVRHA